MDPEKLRVGRDRLTRVFRYLEALNQHRNPPKQQIREQLWTLWLRELPDHPSVRRGTLRPTSDQDPDSSDAKTQIGSQPEEDGFVLKVERPKLTRPPNPPPEIASWLEMGWDNPSKEVSVRQSQNELRGQVESAIIRFHDDSQRVAALEQWKSRRNEWARNERPARAAMKIFETLYELHGRIEREGERVELVVGDGILSWRRPEGGVYHPVVLQRLQLQFNPSTPDFTLSETEHPVELYSALFQAMADVDARAIGRCRDELDQGNYHPLGDDSTSGFLRRLVVQLSPQGEFVEGGAPEGEKENPRIGRDPVLFLRARMLGFASAIEGVLENLRSREDIPWSLLNIVGVEPPVPENPQGEPDSSDLRTQDEEVLLSKPANPEQIRIAQQVRMHGAVLVQGPPGTGKTHTIGNLIGHFLAQGKSVLVTSHTTKALRMVRQHVVSELRPLCVAVLESDLESRKQLESAVGTIAETLSRADAKSLEEESGKLAIHRRELLGRLHGYYQRLRGARADEYIDIAVAGKSWSPSEAARKVSEERGTHDWILSPITPGASLPLSEGELIDLYRTNASVSQEDEYELSAQLPTLGALMSPGDFGHLICERQRLSNEDLQLRSDLWSDPIQEPTIKSLEILADELKRCVEPLSGTEKWKLAVVYAGKHGGAHQEPWEQLVSLARMVHREAAGAQEIFLRYDLRLSRDLDIEEQERTTGEILSFLERGGRLGFFALLRRRQWRSFIETARVADKKPRLAEHFNALRKLSRLTCQRRDLARRWDRQLAPLGVPPSSQIGGEIEKTAVQFCDGIGDCLGWHQRVWSPLEKRLTEYGFQWTRFLSEQPAVVGANGDLIRLNSTVTKVLPALAARANYLRWRDIEARMRELRGALEAVGRDFATSTVMTQLRDAVSQLDVEGYRMGYERLLDLQQRASELGRRGELLQRLEEVAPAWASAIRARSGAHGQPTIPGDALAAWLWLQLNDELERRGSVSLEQLQAEIEKLQEELRHVTVDLIDRSAWAFQGKRTSLHQRQALVGWLDTIRKIGKGYGIRVPYLRAEAARKMTACRSAVPVWVMPLSRVVENFDPRTTRFDVVIIDEASQSDVMALIALYLGRAVVVVGDHEQVSPAAVGQELSVVQNLILQYLQGIPNHDLYDGQTSVYDLARQSFGGTTCLIEHFRCVSEIIQFSNYLSYDGRIKPLRDPSDVHTRPHVIPYRVSGACREGKINRQEAATVASLIVAALEQEEYRKNDKGDPTSFGVVSLVGEEQALEIDKLLRNYLSPGQYEHHRLLCGTAAQFQGDERDVVLISLVDTAEEGTLPLRDQQMFKQRFNVAASRARNQMWVVHSLNPHTDLRVGDLRRRLIEHANDPTGLLRLLEEKEKRTQSVFERDVMKRLVTSGYRVTPQWKVGIFRIDLVVEGNGRRLAIECDGDRYHPLEKLPDDMERQAILERLGWVFARIRGSVFFRDPDRAMKSIFHKLRILDIPPVGESLEAEHTSELENELIESVVRRADELRRTWSEPVGFLNPITV